MFTAILLSMAQVPPPVGWLDYCQRTRCTDEQPASSPASLKLSTLDQVQWEMGRIRRVSDRERYGVDEYWAVADKWGGDCEDIALAARARLLGMGWPSSSLRLATATTEQGEHHAVLTADIGERTYVLDSRHRRVFLIKELEALGYRFLSIQSRSGGGWVEVLP